MVNNELQHTSKQHPCCYGDVIKPLTGPLEAMCGWSGPGGEAANNSRAKHVAKYGPNCFQQSVGVLTAN